MKVLCIGHAAYDITIPFEGYPEENTKNRVTERVECGGGPASNAAYLLGKWGVETYFSGIVGNDKYGNIIKKEFESVNVDTTYLQMDDNVKTTSSFVLVNKNNGSRTLFTYRPEDYYMKMMDYNFTPDIILLDGQELELSLKAIKDFPKAITILDAGRVKESTMQLSKLVDYTIGSHDFAEVYTGIKMDLNTPSDIVNIFSKMKKDIKGNLIITFEEKGALYIEDNKVKLIPSIVRKAHDTTGAGDIFHGAFTYAVANNMELKKAIMISNIAGALSVEKVGGRYSIPTLSEVISEYERNT